MSQSECRTQAEFDAAIKAGNLAVLVEGEFSLVCTGTQAPEIIVRAGATLRVEARESSQPRVEARGSSQPRVEAWGSSQPRVEAWESSQPRVVARESSQPRVEARGYVQLAVAGAVIATCATTCQVRIEGTLAKVEGGQQIIVPPITTAREWCDWYGVHIDEGGVATLYKAVDQQFMAGRGHVPTPYTPGTVPEARDWDGGTLECGGGLHFSPHPAMTLEFAPPEPRFVACPVRVDDIVVHENPRMPQKVKAPRCCAPVYEVDLDGEPVPAATPVAAGAGK